MLTYEVTGKILRLIVTGDVMLHELEANCKTARDDPAVLDESVVLVDALHADVTFKDALPSVRMQTLIDGLGPKFARVCALIEPAHDPYYGIAFQSAGQRLGVKIGLFQGEQAAVSWLKSELGLR